MTAIKQERLPFTAKDRSRLEDHQSSTEIRRVRSFVLNGGKWRAAADEDRNYCFAVAL